MTLEHQRDIDWSDDIETVSSEEEAVGSPIVVWWTTAVMGAGGSYAVWHEDTLGGAPVEDRLNMTQAIREVERLQRENGSPVLEEVQKG